MTAVREDCRSARVSSAWADQAWSDPARSRVLVIDDEPHIRAFVARALRQAGYQVAAAASAPDGIERARADAFDLVILDLIMPDLDGRQVQSEILRARPGQAVLVLSCSSDVSTKVECLDLGARDYLTKPFSLAELVARVRAGLRETAKRNEVMRIGDLMLDAARLVADSGDGPVALTRLEFLCLRALMDHAGGPVTKSELLASVWGIDFDPGSNLVDVCIKRLRAKLGFTLIETVRGEGYRLAC
jgi:two-component system, OmpR family, response regulator